LRERSCVRHDQVPKWTGMRPLVRIDRTGQYHRWLLGVALAPWGPVGACGPAPIVCLADALTAGPERTVWQRLA